MKNELPEQLTLTRDSVITLEEKQGYKRLLVDKKLFIFIINLNPRGIDLKEWFYLLQIFRMRLLNYRLVIKPNMTFFAYIEGIGSVPEKEGKDADIYTDTIPSELNEPLVKMLEGLTALLRSYETANKEDKE